MSLLMVIIGALLIVMLVMLFAGVRNALAMKRDFNQRFDRLRSGLETDATHIVQPLLRERPVRSGPSQPRQPPLRRVK